MVNHLYIIHLSSSLLLCLVVVIVETRYRGHVVVVFALGVCLVCSIFACVFLDVFCSATMITFSKIEPCALFHLRKNKFA